ncbi:hypothetical protein MASR2M47_15790 [Draconibacterium sp.]|jgi:hypothetical protein
MNKEQEIRKLKEVRSQGSELLIAPLGACPYLSRGRGFSSFAVGFSQRSVDANSPWASASCYKNVAKAYFEFNHSPLAEANGNKNERREEIKNKE